jgi:hypothetical protein
MMRAGYMVVRLPFDQPGRFYRGNLHTHSTRSDGTLDPAEVARLYREHGYDFLAITDHFLRQYDWPIVDTTLYRTDDFTTIIGAELHVRDIASGSPWHILAVGLPFDFAPPERGEMGPQIAARAAAVGAFVGIAHPHWYNLTFEEALSLEAAHAVEVYNETCLQLNDRGDSWYMSDLLSNAGRRLSAYAADDAHFTERPDAFGGWVQVRAESLDPGVLLAALKAGHYYSSQGPTIEEIAVDDTLAVRCSPAQAIYLSGRTGTVRKDGHILSGFESRFADGITEAVFPLDAFTGDWCRVTVLDAAGKRAWSNPIWLEDA